MKLFNNKEDAKSPFLTHTQLTKIFLATTILTISLYIVATVCSLLGSNYFILNFQNTQLDRIEEFLKSYNCYSLISCVFLTLEFMIIFSFELKRFANVTYGIVFYAFAILLASVFPSLTKIFFQFYPLLFYIFAPLVDQFIRMSITKEKFNIKQYLFCLLRFVIATAITFVLQGMILIIKSGNFAFENNIMSLSAHFIYAIEFDIALSVILTTILLLHREKGDSKQWAKFHSHGSSSQMSKKQLLQSRRKNLTKTQKSKLFWLYARFYITQLCAFLLVMVLPFLLGKVIEFLMMYLAFAVARFLLGFKYSLHYKKETTCITVGLIVFCILSLAVPFFYVTLIIAILMGVGLAVLLHLSYKYKGFWLFAQIDKPNKFGTLYVYFDADLSPEHIRKMCIHKNLKKMQTDLVIDYMAGNKISYLAKKYNYSYRMLIYKLDECVELLTK